LKIWFSPPKHSGTKLRVFTLKLRAFNPKLHDFKPIFWVFINFSSFSEHFTTETSEVPKDTVSSEVSVERKPKKLSKFLAKMNYCVQF
jgi:hypothetical protein